MIVNRIFQVQADYILAVVSKPEDWVPRSLDDVPWHGEMAETRENEGKDGDLQSFELYEKTPVASYAEAYDDLVRCNRLAIRQNLDRWAVILSPSAGW